MTAPTTPLPPTEIKFSPDEWSAICRSLERHHGVFYKLFEMGKPYFTDKIRTADGAGWEPLPTACVRWDDDGQFVGFYFNPDFYHSLTQYEREFIICHEALHVILNHAIRGKDLDPDVANIAMDIAINHMLVKNFRFSRERLSMSDDMCWVDTVFGIGKDGTTIPEVAFTVKDIPTDKAFEYYYGLLAKQVKHFGGSLPGNGPQGPIDHHGALPSWIDAEEEVRRSVRELSDPEKKELEKAAREEIEAAIKAHDKETVEHQAGTSPGEEFKKDFEVKPKPKPKWETVITKWSIKYIPKDESAQEQWAVPSRRMMSLGGDLMIPHDLDELHKPEKNKILVYFFIDTSGSVWSLRERFFNAAASLAKDVFEIRLFCFDTQVYETSLEDGTMYGSGGTYFHVMEDKIQRIMQQESVEYPTAVFVITDGYGNKIVPAFPDRWRWFLTPSGYKGHLPKTSEIYSLSDYE